METKRSYKNLISLIIVNLFPIINFTICFNKNLGNFVLFDGYHCLI